MLKSYTYITHHHCTIANDDVCADGFLSQLTIIGLRLRSPPTLLPYIKDDNVRVTVHMKNYTSRGGVFYCGNPISDVETKSEIDNNENAKTATHIQLLKRVICSTKISLTL